MAAASSRSQITETSVTVSLVGGLVGWSAGESVGWWISGRVVWSVGRVVGKWIGGLIGWWVGGLVGWWMSRSEGRSLGQGSVAQTALHLSILSLLILKIKAFQCSFIVFFLFLLLVRN